MFFCLNEYAARARKLHAPSAFWQLHGSLEYLVSTVCIIGLEDHCKLEPFRRWATGYGAGRLALVEAISAIFDNFDDFF